MHDRVAELHGLRAEHARHLQFERVDRAAQVREQLDRVRDELGTEAEQFEKRAEELAGLGQDIPAAQAAVIARELRAVVEQDGESAAAKPKGTTGKRTTTAAKAPEHS